GQTGLYCFRRRDYSPVLGRWIEQDPIGLKAGDKNLYRCAYNDPADILDPRGTIGIFFDGAGQTLASGTTIGWLYEKYAVPGLKGHYVMNLFSSNVFNSVLDAFGKVVAAHKANSKEPVDIFGWSRGGMAALLLAQKLERECISVR